MMIRNYFNPFLSINFVVVGVLLLLCGCLSHYDSCCCRAFSLVASPRFPQKRRSLLASPPSSSSYRASSLLLSSSKKSNNLEQQQALDEGNPNEEEEESSSSSSPIVSSLDRDEHVRLLDQSLQKWTGKGLWEYMMGLSSSSSSDQEFWEEEVHMNMRFALLSHGATNDMDGPIHNYVNFAACSAFQTSRDVLLDFPACRVATPGYDQETWSMILERLRENSDKENDKESQVLQDYQGYRCTLSDQSRFYIRDALVWNCYNEQGAYYGQAILFDREKVAFVDE